MVSSKQTLIFFSFILLITVQASSQRYKKDSIPQPTGFVNDFENILTKSQEIYLDSMIRAFEKRKTIQIALITIDTFMTSRVDFDNYTLKIANAWGVGQKRIDNGIVIGISKGYRTMRIENGSGIVKRLSDIETKKIIDTAFIPYFKKGQYFEGIMNGIKTIMNKFK